MAQTMKFRKCRRSRIGRVLSYMSGSLDDVNSGCCSSSGWLADVSTEAGDHGARTATSLTLTGPVRECLSLTAPWNIIVTRPRSSSSRGVTHGSMMQGKSTHQGPSLFQAVRINRKWYRSVHGIATG